ncbi:MAG: glucose 1-dehydrogenase [Chloroflexota bacterium]|jgi:NAD(P)-dependent dehydrogenase (short-subunit alcohol dehydrogenase family)|nr:glucose 1-dehydrogenase [Chloroflexota bacterium]
MQLEDKIALVTGAGRGMGRAISLQLAEEGANVAVSDIDASTAEDTAIAIKQMGRESLVLPADMGDLNDINRMFTQAKDAFGRLDVVVNNAGVTKYLDIMDVEEEDWDRIHRVNAKGVFFCMQRAARELIDQGAGGRIINIASIAGKGYAGTSNAAYAASKGAVISMTSIAALQLGRYDINVNAICPGSTLTTMAADTMSGRAERTGQTMEELEGARDARIPIGRPNEPEDIAAMALFLAGPGARNITGQAFNVDGGLVMH